MLGWLTKIALVLAVFGILAFDGIAVAQGHVVVATDADDAALAARDAYGPKHDLEGAYQAALDSLAEQGDVLVPDGFTFNAKTGVFTVTAQRSVDTIVLKHTGVTRDWATMQATGQARVAR